MSASETWISSESTETPRLIPVMNGGACDGFLLSRGVRVEAFDKDENSLGVFPDAPGAVAAVRKSAAPAHSRFGGSTAPRVLR
jgi:hypothetical protein